MRSEAQEWNVDVETKATTVEAAQQCGRPGTSQPGRYPGGRVAGHKGAGDVTMRADNEVLDTRGPHIPSEVQFVRAKDAFDERIASMSRLMSAEHVAM